MQPITTTPVTTGTFDKVWIQTLIISGNPTGKVSATAVLKPYDGTNTLNDSKVLNIPDVFGLAATDPQFATIVTSLISEIARQARNQNII